MKPSSLRRIRASRANGARSRGPRTPEGKARSSQNAVRHGLLAKCVVLAGESRDGFDALLAQHLARFGPLDGVDQGFIEEMVSATWRLRRAWAMETRLFDEAVEAQPPGNERSRMAAALSVLAVRPEFALLHRYETRLHMMYQRGLQNFLLLRETLPPDAPPVTPDPSDEPSQPAKPDEPRPPAPRRRFRTGRNAHRRRYSRQPLRARAATHQPPAVPAPESQNRQQCPDVTRTTPPAAISPSRPVAPFAANTVEAPKHTGLRNQRDPAPPRGPQLSTPPGHQAKRKANQRIGGAGRGGACERCRLPR